VRRPSTDGERGASTLEVLGVTAAGVVLVVALVVAMVGFGLGDRVAATLCQLVPGASCAGPPTDRTAAERVPPEPCVVGGNGGAARGSVAVGVQIDGGYTWFVEELGDGKYRLTRTGEAGIGAEIGWGFDVSATVDDRRYGLALSAGAAATAALRNGEVYYASSDAEVQEILAAAMADDVKDSVVGDDWFGRDVVDWVTGASDKEQLTPDSTFIVAGVDVSGAAAATLATLDASADVQGGIYEGTTEYADGRTTDVFTAGSTGNAQASGLLGDHGVTDDVLAAASYAGGITVEVDRDKDGNPTAMRLVTLGSAHADVDAWDNPGEAPSYTETTWQVPLDSTANRVVAGRLALGLGLAVPGVTDTLSPLDFGAFNYGASWGDFQDLAKDEGYAWEQQYELDESTHGGSFDAKWFLEAGLSGEYTGTNRTATSYTYWDGSGFVDRAGCVVAG